MSRTKAEQAEATRRRLVRVARRLFGRRGFNAVSAEEVVAAAGLTRGALYHHFGGKEGLFRAVVGEVMGEVKVRVAQASVHAGSPLAAVEAGVSEFLAVCAEPATQRVLLVDGPAVLGWHDWRGMDLDFGLGLLRSGLEAAMAARQIAVPDAEIATHLLAGALVDGAMLIGRSPGDSTIRGDVEATLLELLRGLATAKSPGS